MAPGTQARILRALETRTVDRIGGTQPVPVDLRVVAATNKDLSAAVQDRTFREDLYYRLNVLPLHVPPLRERRGDVALLAAHFLDAFCAAEGQAAKHVITSYSIHYTKLYESRLTLVKGAQFLSTVRLEPSPDLRGGVLS